MTSPPLEVPIDAIIFGSMSLAERARSNACVYDLDVATELLRLGTTLVNVTGDALSICYLLQAANLALRYEMAEIEADLDKATVLIRKATTEFLISASNAFYKSTISGEVSRVHFVNTKRHKDIVSAFSCCCESLTASNDKSTVATSKPDAYRKIAQALREAYYVVTYPLVFSSAYHLAQISLKDIQKLAQSWESRFPEREIHTILGEIQRSRFNKYNALDMSNASVFHFRESAKLVNPRDSHFRQKAIDCCGILRQRIKQQHSATFQKQINRQEAISWAVQMIKAAPSFRRSEMVNAMLELGHLIGDLNLHKTYARNENSNLSQGYQY